MNGSNIKCTNGSGVTAGVTGCAKEQSGQITDSFSYEKDRLLEDIDKDGRLDIWTVVCAELSPESGGYQIIQFCPEEDYDEIKEAVLIKQEVEQMLEKDIVIQDEFFVSYDSERRIGTRGEREALSKDSIITEYRYEESCRWRPVSPDTLIHESYPDERLREAIGEECYEKINGVFYNVYVG